MARSEVIRKRLNKLNEYLQILKGLQKYSYEEFIRNAEHYGTAERFLHLSIETLTDMGNHIIAELELGIVNSYGDVPAILAKTSHIDADLKNKWIRMIGFRNILIHDYLEIDRKIVYDVLQNSLADIDAIKRIFATFL
jgi:uncharacterized protein YutE (UPF0331/DUF86 family)